MVKPLYIILPSSRKCLCKSHFLNHKVTSVTKIGRKINVCVGKITYIVEIPLKSIDFRHGLYSPHTLPVHAPCLLCIQTLSLWCPKLLHLCWNPLGRQTHYSFPQSPIWYTFTASAGTQRGIKAFPKGKRRSVATPASLQGRCLC